MFISFDSTNLVNFKDTLNSMTQPKYFLPFGKQKIIYALLEIISQDLYQLKFSLLCETLIILEFPAHGTTFVIMGNTVDE